MPTVAVDALELVRRVGPSLGSWVVDESHQRFQAQQFADKFTEQLEHLCFEFGLEYDGLETEGARDKLRIEVGANRYDLLCIEGISDALLRFTAETPKPFPRFTHTITQPTAQGVITVHRSVKAIRPYCVGAIFRNVKLDETSFASFIDLQDKLHQNIGRRRTLVAIGTHNLDVLEGPFTFQAPAKKGGFKFVPLNQTQEVDGEGMFTLLENSYLKPYLPIIRDFEQTPAIIDAKQRVASIPPIINADFCKMSKDTQNVFVEITATDFRKANIALDMITAFMADKMPEPFTVEPVRIEYEHEGVPSLKGDFCKSLTVPSLKTEKFNVSVEYVRRVIGLPSLTKKEIMSVLPKMSLLVSEDPKNDDNVCVECPITRRDILHPCDIAEDIAIAIGYNNIPARSHYAVQLQSVQNLSERVRRTIACAGWRECLTFGLISLKDAFADLRREQATADFCKEIFTTKLIPAIVSEPKTREFECVRPTLIPGLLKTLASNQAAELPIRIFEIGDCVSVTESTDNKCKQRRQLAALVADHNRSGLEDIHGLMDVVLKQLKLTAEYALDKPAATVSRMYRLTETSDDATFLKGRCVNIDVYEPSTPEVLTTIGIMGVVHPEVLSNFGIPFPCSLIELSLEPFLQWLQTTDQSAP